jgi:ribonuclease P protein component
MDAARLRRSNEIAAVRSEGTKLHDPLFAMRARPNGIPLMRLAVSAPRSVGRATRRNRARRRVREAFRVEIACLVGGEGHDLLIVARPSAVTAPMDALRRAARAAVSRLRSDARAG